MQFSFRAAFALGWQTFRSRYGALLGAAVVVMFAPLAVFFVTSSARAAFVGEVPDLSTQPGQIALPFVLRNASFDLLLGVLFNAPLYAGFLLLALKHTRGESPPLGVLFAGFSERYAPLVGIGALSAAPLLLAAGLSVYVPPSPMFLLLIPVGVVLAVRFSFCWLLCVDPRRRLGVIESYSTSWRLTGPDRVLWPLLGVVLSLILISVLCAVPLFLPLVFFAMPFTTAVIAACYELIAGSAESGAPADAAP